MTGARAVRAAPAGADRVFGDRLPLVVRYAELLATDGVTRGLIGRREVDRLWDRHLLNCAAVGQLIPAGSTVVDVGSGAGLPGIPLALVDETLHMTLVDPMLRRTTFLSECLGTLGLDRVRIVRGRADDQDVLQACSDADVVVARAVAPLDRLARWCLPLLRTGGVLLAIKGERATDEVATHRSTVLSAGASAVEVVHCRTEAAQTDTTVVTVTRSSRKGGRSR